MILIKQHNSHQVAHLYEHLFCMAIDDFFYENELYPHLDYDYTAKTIYGVLYLRVDCNTAEARGLESKIPHLKISHTDVALNTTLIQIGTELGRNLGVAGEGKPDWDKVREELLMVEEKPWQDIKNVDVIDPRAAKLVPGSFYVPKDETKIPIQKMSVLFVLDKEFSDEHKELLPLYSQISELMSESIRVDLCSLFGFYSYDLKPQPKDQALKVAHQFRIPEAYPLDILSVAKVTEATVCDLLDSGALRRLAEQLSEAGHSDPKKIFPGVNYTFERTGLIVGEKAWRRIATSDNCELVIGHMKIVIAANGKKTTIEGSSIVGRQPE